MAGHNKIRHDSESLPACILIVEDQTDIREFMSKALRLDGHRVEEAISGQQAIEILSDGHIDLLIADLAVSDVNGTELLHSAKQIAPGIEIVVMTAEDIADQGRAMIREGAYDALMKPFTSERLNHLARRALERKSLVKKVHALEGTIRRGTPFDEIVGSSKALTDVLKIVRQIARLENAVLISGESGTGKELVARTLHALSARSESPFTVINCGAIPESLQDGEIFGQVGETPDGAGPRQRGLVEASRGGTVYLDDVADLAPPAQQNLLRLLQNGEARPNGTPAAGDVRVITATRRNLEKRVEDGAFSEDLFYRLNVISIQIPPLRQRIEDIPLLARHFLKAATQKEGGGPTAISPRTMSVLTAHPWEGNVRELKNFIERAVVLDRDGIIGLDDLPFLGADGAADKIIDRAKSGSLTLGELEREYILEVLADCGGSRKKTAAKLGVTTATLWRKLKRFEKSGP